MRAGRCFQLGNVDDINNQSIIMGRSCATKQVLKISQNCQWLSGQALSNAFNDYFVSLVKERPESDACKCINARNNQFMLLMPVTASEVISVFIVLKIEKAATPMDCRSNRLNM